MADDLLAAISAAVDNADPKPETQTDDAPDDASVDDSAAGSEGDAAAGESNDAGSDLPGADATGETSNDVAVSGGAAAEVGTEGKPVLGADGKPVAAPAKAGDPAAKVADGKAAAVAKTPDPVNDPIDPRLKTATRDRITALVGTAKDLTGKLETATAERDEILGYIKQTGATPEQYSQTLGYLSLVNSQNPADQEKALEIMLQEVQVLSRMLGKPVAGVDLVSEHPDLVQAVRDGDISAAHAQELAASRARGQFTNARATAQQNADQNAAAQAAAQTTGRNALNALDAALQKDPNYAYKRAILVKTLQPVMQKISPLEWAGTFKAAYDAIPAPAPAPAAGARAAPRIPQNTPLRPTNPAGAATKAAGSLAEAIDFGIQQGTRR